LIADAPSPSGDNLSGRDARNSKRRQFGISLPFHTTSRFEALEAYKRYLLIAKDPWKVMHMMYRGFDRDSISGSLRIFPDDAVLLMEQVKRTKYY